ncbi:hypothetical protein FALCPG4_006690 [Fusarium falciforme]
MLHTCPGGYQIRGGPRLLQRSRGQQPQRFSLSKALQSGGYGPTVSYPATSGWLGLTFTPTDKDTKTLNGAITLISDTPGQYGQYIALVTGACYGNVTLPLKLA